MRRSLRCAASIAILLSASEPALAQSAPPAPVSSASPTAPDANAIEARRQFEVGVEALRDERYADALTAFRASYTLRRAASVSLNLGITLRALGRLVESREYLQEFLRDASAAQHAEHDQLVQGYLLDLSRRIGVLEVRMAPDAPSDVTYTIDSRRVVLDASSSTAIDPGDHVNIARAHGWRTERRELHVDAGARVSSEFAMTRTAAAIDANRVLASPAPTPARDMAPPSWRLPVLVTAGVLVVAAAIIIPVAVVSASGYDDPANSSTGIVIQGLQR